MAQSWSGAAVRSRACTLVPDWPLDRPEVVDGQTAGVTAPIGFSKVEEVAK